MYVYRGVCSVGSTELKEGQMGTLTAGSHLKVKAAAASTARLLLIAGVPLVSCAYHFFSLIPLSSC